MLRKPSEKPGAMKRRTTTTGLHVAVLVLSLLFVTCGRGYLAVAQCLHATLPPVVQFHSDHHGYDIHHHSVALPHTDDNLTHDIVHILDSIEYSVPVVLPCRQAPKPVYSWVMNGPPLPTDVTLVPLYRPPRSSLS
jgi:hypothetical protein